MDEVEEERRDQRKQLFALLKGFLSDSKVGFEIFYCEKPPATKKKSRFAVFLVGRRIVATFFALLLTSFHHA